MASANEIDSDVKESMIVVMGVTGSGKSHFINTLIGGAVHESGGLNSGQSHPE